MVFLINAGGLCIFSSMGEQPPTRKMWVRFLRDTLPTGKKIKLFFVELHRIVLACTLTVVVDVPLTHQFQLTGFGPSFLFGQESEQMFITKKYGLVSSRSEYIMLAYADRICRERHKAENERHEPVNTKNDKKVRYSVKPPRMKL